MADQPYRPGNRDDFDRLYRSTYSRVRFTLQGMLRDADAAEDCTQEAFVRAFRAWPGWKPDAPAEAWVHRIAINTALSYGRHQRVKRAVEMLVRPRTTTPDAGAERMELIDALRHLPPRHAALVVLRYHHGYSNREIAVALGVAESTVSSRLQTARRQLLAMLGERVSLDLGPELR